MVICFKRSFMFILRTGLAADEKQNKMQLQTIKLLHFYVETLPCGFAEVLKMLIVGLIAAFPSSALSALVPLSFLLKIIHRSAVAFRSSECTG